MPTTYTRENFSRSDVPNGFNRDAKNFISRAIELGWRMLVTNKGHVTLISYDDAKTINLSVTKSDGPLQRMSLTLVKYADPSVTKPEPKVAPKPKPSPDPVQVAARTSRPEPPLVDASGKPLRVEPEEGVSGPKLLHESPMMSKGGHGKEYPSDIAVERKWSDGTTDYKCARCEFVGKAPLSMSAHWRKHVREDEANRGGHAGPSIKASSDDYKPRAETVESLSQVMKDLIDSGDIPWGEPYDAAEVMARAALRWQHERRAEREQNREPLTPEQVIERIRNLVDFGYYETQQATIEQMREQIEALNAERDDLQERVTKMRNTLSTFAELVSGEIENEEDTDG